MRKIISLVLVGSMLSTASLVYAATGDEEAAPAPAQQDVQAQAVETIDTVMTAAPVDPVLPVAGSSAGEYKSVSCSSNPAFANNSCNQCFDGGSVKVGDKLTGLFDNWTNSSAQTLSAYKEEQKTPNMVKFGNLTTWTTSPALESGVWAYSSDIVWIPPKGTETKSQYLLAAGQKVKFVEANLGAGYTLDKTDRKNGEMVGMLRFPVVYHTIDANAKESEAVTHYECVSYKLDAPVAPAATGATKAPTPTQVTQTKTGPETLLLIAAAFFISFGMMFTLRKRS